MKTTVLLFWLLLCTFFRAPAQLLSGNAFLKGKYAECGIAPNGTLGSGVTAPSNFHSLVAGVSPAELGLVVDFARDGWGVGKPKWIGDYIMPGVPHEGWDVEVNGFTGRAMRSRGDNYMSFGLAGSISDYSLSGTEIIVHWSGTMNDLHIEKEMIFDTNRLFLTFNIKLINKGVSDLRKVYYQRTVDPDNEYEQVGGGGYATIQKLEHNMPDPQHLALVSATGHDYRSYLGLFTRDCRARPYFLRSSLVGVQSLDSFYNQLIDTSLIEYTLGDSLFYDVGMGLVFNIGTLKSGDSAYISYAYLFDKTELPYVQSHAFQPALRVRGKSYYDGDTLYACQDEWLDVSVLAAGHEFWKWPVSTVFNDSEGKANRILIHDTVSVQTWRPYAPSCGGGRYDSLRVTIIGTKPARPVLSRFGVMLSVANGYTAYQWYNNGTPVGSGGSSYEMKMNGTYYVQVTDSNGCEAVSDSLVETGLFVDEFTIADTDIELFPNPSAGLVSVNAPASVQIKVFDIQGRLLQQSAGATRIDIKSLADGVYLFYLYRLDGTAIGSRRVVKQKE
ncbi:MAG: T9SS type A sorting domain-containing protein [Chitinophagaceae bacterium]